METLNQAQEALAGLQPGITLIGVLIFAAGVAIQARRFAIPRPREARLSEKTRRELTLALGHEPPAIRHDGQPGIACMQLGLIVAAAHPLLWAIYQALQSSI